MSVSTSTQCPDCESSFDRRGFLKMAGASAAAFGATSLFPTIPGAFAAPSTSSQAETAVGRLYESLTDAQALKICLPYNHKLRSRINANWRISQVRISEDDFSRDQLKLVDEVIRGVTSEDGYELFQRQMKADGGGISGYSFAIFGEPGKGDFQWEMTGRHLTLRADGNSAPGSAFGGPIVYGHGVGNPSRNLFYHQTRQANEVFKALDPKQAKAALVEDSPSEDEVALQGKGGRFPGIAVSELSNDQKELVEKTLKVLLSPYRDEDVKEVMAILKEGGGLDSLHMSFYQDSDLLGDRIWDVWRVEGPSFVWHFRGDPHVHAYINIGMKDAQAAASKSKS